MASVLADLYVNLIGNDASLLAMAKRSSAALEGTASTSKSVQSSISAMGKGSAIALAAIGTYSLESAAKFQQSMNLIHTQAGASTDQVNALSKSVLNLAGQVGQSPDKLAEGLYHIASAGAPASQWMDILTQSAKEASIGIADMDTVSNALVGVMMTAPKDIHSAADATAFLNQTVGIGNMKMTDLVSAIGTGVLPAFKSAGLGMKDFSATLATLTDLGEPANQAATRLRTSVALMAAPSSKASAALKEIGLTSDQLAKDMAGPGGMIGAIEDLHKHLEGLSLVKQNQILNEAFGGARSGSTIEALVQNIPKLQQKYEQLGTASSRAAKQQEAWQATQQNFNQQRKEFTAGLQAMAIQLGEKLLPYVTKFVGFLASHQTAMKAFFAVIIIGLALMTAAWLAMSLSMMANPVFWIIAGIVAAVALLAIGIYELVKHWSTVWGWIKRIAMDVWHWLVDAWHATWNAVMAVVHWIGKNIIDPIVAYFKFMLNFWISVWHGMQAAALWVKANIVDRVVNLFKGMVKAFMDVFNAVIGFFRKWWPLLLMIFLPFIGILIAIWNHFHKQIMDAVHTVWNLIMDVLKTVWQAIVVAAKFVWELIKTNVINPVIDVWHTLEKIWDLIVAYARLAWATLTAWAKSAWEGIKSTIISPIEHLLNDLGALWGKIWDKSVSFFKGLWDWISGWVGKFFDIGTNIVQGIINGIDHAASWLYDKIKNVANGALKAATSFLGIHSPSKVFADVVGKSIPEGIAVGIKANAMLPQAALTGSVTAPLVGNAGAMTPVLAGGYNQTVTIQNNLYIDGRQLQAASIRQSQRYKLRNSATGLT